MAHLLLLDDQLAAQRVFPSILERGDHSCDVASTPDEAWALLDAHVQFDLVVMELRFGGGADGFAFLRKVRADPFFQGLPIVVYTGVSDRKTVRAALDCRPQNYLIKPYEDDLIHQEIAKAFEQGWLRALAPDPSAAAQRSGVTVESIRGQRESLATALGDMETGLRQFVPPGEPDGARPGEAVAGAEEARSRFTARIATLADLAAAAVTPGIGRWLAGLTGPPADASAAAALAELFARARRVVESSPDRGERAAATREALRRAADARAEQARRASVGEAERQEQRRWAAADLSAGPLVEPQALLARAAALSGCPVIASVAAAFQMAVSANLASLASVQHLVLRDPGLAAQILISANRLNRDDGDAISSLRGAVGWLGNARLQALGRSLVTADEDHLAPLSWTQFWMFQVGVAHLAEFVCEALEQEHLARTAYNAGLMHDIGQLVLLKLHPYSFRAITEHARRREVARAGAEQRFFGCTAREVGETFALRHGLPGAYAEVIRRANQPENAIRNRDLVAIVALARHLCLRYQIGDCGEWTGDLPRHLEDTTAWPILNEQVFPGFNWRKFSAQAHARILRLKNELRGRPR
ncbi:response regulator with CheY-like receiver, AAA-type ATPase, and DNA-binding domains [Opitutaceae bacterium TAV1]|nr:response regulator with CheY-like receiver, AAA-type ATPase, and DNA-binding domains [Opitutaceae bacterium TAV1]